MHIRIIGALPTISSGSLKGSSIATLTSKEEYESDRESWAGLAGRPRSSSLELTLLIASMVVYVSWALDSRKGGGGERKERIGKECKGEGKTKI